jgi:hypothetical protein
MVRVLRAYCTLDNAALQGKDPSFLFDELAQRITAQVSPSEFWDPNPGCCQ